MPETLARLTLVLGGARSGKSRYAEAQALRSGLEPVYLATAQALDAEMQARIDRHRDDRDRRWRTVEEPLELAAVLRREATAGRVVLVDCLTLWLTNMLLAKRDAAAARQELLAALSASAGAVILVSNEVGLGVVPLGELTRQFVDGSGLLHQAVAAVAEHVVLMVAGLPLELKRPAAG
ncbi:MAG: bifunctional adenosylcobinamide kinase/adenosylcobinamide-phosphate guanylyltransferase [Geminicoccaceae bacterium]